MGGGGPERGQGQGMPKKTPRPRPLSGAGRGKGPGARVFRGPIRPVTNSTDNLLVANHLIPLHRAVTHHLIARAQASIHSPDLLPTLVLPTPTTRHLGQVAANRVKIQHLGLTIVATWIEEWAIANFCREGK